MDVSGRLLVVCKGDQTLEVLDLASGTTTARITASGFTPHEVAASSDGTRAYLPIYSDVFLGQPGTDGRHIDVIDLIGMRVADGIPIEFASRPHCAAVGSDELLYVGTELDESVSVFDPSSGARVRRLPSGRAQSHMFTLSPDGSRAYTANVDTGSVSVIDVATESLVQVIEVAGVINRISVTPDGSTLFCADQEQPRLAVIDVATTAVSWIELPSRGFGTAVTPDGRSLVIALRDASQIGVIDLASRRLVAQVDVPSYPQEIVLHPDGIHAYSACDAAREVVEVDLIRNQVSRIFATGADADGMCWAPMPAPGG
jgi:YVTN family beta-propeller protein